MSRNCSKNKHQINMNSLCLALVAYLLPLAIAQTPRVRISATSPEAFHNVIQARRDHDVTMDCSVENLPSETSVRWQKMYYDSYGRMQLQKVSQGTGAEDNTKVSIEKPTAYTWRLRLRSAQITDEGNYTCYVTITQSGLNRVEANMTVHVLVPPIIIEGETSPSMVVKAGDTIDMNCNALGRPPPTIEWSRLGNALLPIGKEKHMHSKMTILSVKAEDRGTYRCTMGNVMGVISRDITLDVRFKPIIEAKTEVYQAVGYLIELQCLVEANPFPHDEEVSWFKGATSISSSIGRYKVNKIEGAFSQLTYELIISDVKKSDFDTYVCQVRNSEGTSSARIALIESDTPQASVKLGETIMGGGSNILVMSVSTLVMCGLVTLIHNL